MAERKNSEARIRANNKYNNKAYDRINIAVPKGQKDIIKAHAEARGESVNGFVNRAIEEAMGHPEIVSAPSAGPLSQETMDAAQKAAQFTGESVSQFLDRAVDMQAKRDKLSASIKKTPPKSAQSG